MERKRLITYRFYKGVLIKLNYNFLAELIFVKQTTKFAFKDRLTILGIE